MKKTQRRDSEGSNLFVSKLNFRVRSPSICNSLTLLNFLNDFEVGIAASWLSLKVEDISTERAHSPDTFLIKKTSEFRQPNSLTLSVSPATRLDLVQVQENRLKDF